eukprot:gene28534-31853_t
MLKSSRMLTGLALVVASLSLAVPTLAEDKVVAKVDGAPVTDKDLSTLMTNLGQQLAQVPEGARKRAALDRLIDMRILAAAADKEGLGKSPEFQARLDTIRQQLLITEFVKTKVEAGITEEMIKARYDKEAAGFGLKKDVKIDIDEEALKAK